MAALAALARGTPIPHDPQMPPLSRVYLAYISPVPHDPPVYSDVAHGVASGRSAAHARPRACSVRRATIPSAPPSMATKSDGRPSFVTVTCARPARACDAQQGSR